MNKFQKATAVAVMVGGMALSGGVAHACDGGKGKSDDKPSGVAIDNLQAVECEQEVGSLITVPVQVTVLGDSTQVVGNNFCTVVGPDGS
ncbi:hypothetical protein [Streptomyces caelestis]|uniref:hypothetical protein n=1 Tax=Streptomyces caelestis TaxID=36816 RepID=UPI0036F5A42B